MLIVKIEGLEELKRTLSDAPREIQVAAQRALLKTAHGIREAEIAEMQRVFDRPTRWTLGAVRVKATSRFTVEVGILDPDGYYKRAANYLGTQIEGGQRRHKAMEKSLQKWGVMPEGMFAVPGAGAKIDAFGNMSSGQIRQILSWFHAAENWAGSTQNMTDATRDKRRKGTRKSIGFEYFAVVKDTSLFYHNKSLKQPGIYQRFFFGQGKAIKPVLIFVKGARYKARFNFEKVATDIAKALWNAEFNKALRIGLDR